MSTTANKKDFQDVEMAPLMGQAQSSMPKGGMSSNSHTAVKSMLNTDIKPSSSDSNNALPPDDEKKRSQALAGKAVTACLMYSTCSVVMVLVNKSLASR